MKLIDKICSLTIPQRAAITKIAMTKKEWKSAYELDIGLNTLNALARKGYLEKRTNSLSAWFSPRTANEYRLKEQP